MKYKASIAIKIKPGSPLSIRLKKTNHVPNFIQLIIFAHFIGQWSIDRITFFRLFHVLNVL
jgi:hypothetical protein